jgi:hypothetical protein
MGIAEGGGIILLCSASSKSKYIILNMSVTPISAVLRDIGRRSSHCARRGAFGSKCGQAKQAGLGSVSSASRGLGRAFQGQRDLPAVLITAAHQNPSHTNSHTTNPHQILKW